MSNIQELLNQLSAAVTTLQAEKDQLTTQVAALQTEKDQLTTQVTALQTKVTGMQTAILADVTTGIQSIEQLLGPSSALSSVQTSWSVFLESV